MGFQGLLCSVTLPYYLPEWRHGDWVYPPVALLIGFGVDFSLPRVPGEIGLFGLMISLYLKKLTNGVNIFSNLNPI